MNKAEQVQIDLLRAMTPAQKLELVRSMTLAVQRLAFIGLRDLYPDATEDELWLRLAARRLGPDLMKKVYGWEEPK